MKFWFDTEFEENGKTIELISIGIVAEDGDEFYAEVEGFQTKEPWLLNNVIPYLTGKTMKKEDIGLNIFNFITAKTDRPEFWAYFADYDWVVFCQLYGRMTDLPDEYPFYCNDLKQELMRLNIKRTVYIE